MVLTIGGFIWLFRGGGTTDETVSSPGVTSAASGGGSGAEGTPDDAAGDQSDGAGAAQEEEDDYGEPPDSDEPLVPIAVVVFGEPDWVIVPDPDVVTTITSNQVMLSFTSSGGPFTGSAAIEFLHDVPSEGCHFNSTHKWEFSGHFTPATLEFRGSYHELTDVTTGNCTADQLQFVYRSVPPSGDFYAGLYYEDGEIWGTGFSEFRAPVSQEVIDAVLAAAYAAADDGDDPRDVGGDADDPAAKPQVAIFAFATPLQLGSPGEARFSVSVQNTGPVSWAAGEFTDEVFGNLFDVGTPGTNSCAVDNWTLDPGDVKICGFWVDVPGPAPRDQSSRIIIKVFDGDGDSATAIQATIVKLVSGASQLVVDRTPDQAQIPNEVTPVTFTVSVRNASSEVVTLTYLHDDVFGDLLDEDNPLALGNLCATTGTRLTAQGVFECTFVGVVIPTADGEPHVNTVAALVHKGEEPFASGAATVVVSFAE